MTTTTTGTVLSACHAAMPWSEGRGDDIVKDMDFDEALKLLATFEREQLRYVLVGSMALAYCLTTSGM